MICERSLRQRPPREGINEKRASIFEYRIADVGVIICRKREVPYGSHNQYRGFYCWNNLFWDEPAGFAKTQEIKGLF
jgi:hypothetical protein